MRKISNRFSQQELDELSDAGLSIEEIDANNRNNRHPAVLVIMVIIVVCFIGIVIWFLVH